jgi:hypothetical protein
MQRLSRGELRILHGPLGSGKSDIVEEWFRSIIAAATADAAAAIPIWITIDDLGAALETHILGEVGLPALQQFGVDVVIDGLDEHTNKAASLTRQAGEFVKKWPSSRILLTCTTRRFAVTWRLSRSTNPSHAPSGARTAACTCSTAHQPPAWRSDGYGKTSKRWDSSKALRHRTSDGQHEGAVGTAVRVVVAAAGIPWASMAEADATALAAARGVLERKAGAATWRVIPSTRIHRLSPMPTTAAR